MNLGLLPLLPMLLCAGCVESECENEVREELVSPDGAKRLVIFSRHCGATTAFNAQGMILPVGKASPDDGGNTFIFETEEVSAKWKDSATLEVSIADSVRTYKQEEEVQGVRVVYSVISRDPASAR